jgi:CRP-like cAMP-binding protein
MNDASGERPTPKRVLASSDIPRNRLLAALPIGESNALSPYMGRQEFRPGFELARAGGVASALYFPIRGVVSCVTVMADGQTIEGIVVGPEGVVSAAAAFGVVSNPWDLVVQSDLEALVLPAARAEGLLGGLPTLRRLLAAQMHGLQVLATQSVACNRFHPLHQRAARWLLTVLDRTGGSDIEISHDFLARMLGVQRPSVTLALGTLDRAGLIDRHRMRISVPSRLALQAAACECYAAVNREVGRAFASAA